MNLGNVSPFEYMAMFAIHSLNVKVSTSSKQSTKTPVGGFCCSHACFIATYRFKDASWRKTSIGQPRREFRGGITLKHIILSLLSQESQRKKTGSLTFHFIYTGCLIGILIMVCCNPYITVDFVPFVWNDGFGKGCFFVLNWCSCSWAAFRPWNIIHSPIPSAGCSGGSSQMTGIHLYNTHSDGDWAINWKVKRWRIWEMKPPPTRWAPYRLTQCYSPPLIRVKKKTVTHL